MPKVKSQESRVKSQHPATCWPIDVTQIFKDGMPGRAGPAQGTVG